ncbi:ankyrin repeat-containing domain protein [Dactylonectria estremocensis]|uniref:Ankyrin repeat-containing domain protein n=1 Tax=Dactylonectria estremocensis TaxID=1079267 RepID=A0A9P9J239_9HYPO|nr:ankyrin repeat-containing domain protein [Dactylonectria estremocensis]
MLLPDLPVELLECISENLDSERAISAFSRANRRLHNLLTGYLYRHNARWCGSSALIWAARQGREETVRKALRWGADAQAASQLLLVAALQAASGGGHEKIVQLLIDKNADVNAQGGYYRSALQAASAGGHEKIVQLLIDSVAQLRISAD